MEVSITFTSFTAASYTGTAGDQPVTISSDSNPNNLAHTVTVKVIGNAQFDRMG